MKKLTRQKTSAYSRLHPQFAARKESRLIGREMGFVWGVILSVFVISALLETRAGEQANGLNPDLCAGYLAGPAPAVKGPRYSTYGLGRNPVPATLPNTSDQPRIGFEIAPQLPNHPFLPPRGVAGWVDVDPATGQTLINGHPVGNQAGLSHDEVVEACLALMSRDNLK